MKEITVNIDVDCYGGFHPAATKLTTESVDPAELAQIVSDLAACYLYRRFAQTEDWETENFPDKQVAAVDAVRAMIDGGLSMVWERTD